MRPASSCTTHQHYPSLFMRLLPRSVAPISDLPETFFSRQSGEHSSRNARVDRTFKHVLEARQGTAGDVQCCRGQPFTCPCLSNNCYIAKCDFWAPLRTITAIWLTFLLYLPGIAVTGGALLSQYISEKVIGYIGGTLFVVFAITTAIGIF